MVGRGRSVGSGGGGGKVGRTNGVDVGPRVGVGPLVGVLVASGRVGSGVSGTGGAMGLIVAVAVGSGKLAFPCGSGTP